MKRFILSLVIILLIFIAAVPKVLANVDSEADVGFRAGTLEVDPVPCPMPTPHLFPPLCPHDPSDPGPDPNDVAFFVPDFDFGVHENQIGIQRIFYAIPAHRRHRFLYGNLGQLAIGDIVFPPGHPHYPLTTAQAEDTIGHFVQLTDNRGNFAGWSLEVQRTEFRSTETDVASPIYGHELLGAELNFGDRTAFALTGTQSNLVTGALAGYAVVPVVDPADPTSGPIRIAQAVSGSGSGTHRIQIGNPSTLADANEAYAYRNTTSHLDGTTPHPTIPGTNLARNNGVRLTIPANVPTHETTYISTLTWTISVGP